MQCLVEEPIGLGEHFRRRQGCRHESARDRFDDACGRALESQEPAKTAMRNLRQGDETECAPGRCAVDKYQVVVAACCPFLDTHQGGEFVRTGQERQLVCDDFIDSLIAEQLDDIGSDATPMRLDHVACIDLEGIESRCEPSRLGPERDVEYITQAMRRVRRDHERSQAALCRPGPRRRGRRRLADPSFARIENQPHPANVSRPMD